MLSRLALSLGSLTLTLIALELGLRLLDVRPRETPLRQVEVLGPDGRFDSVAVWGTAPLKRPSPFYGVAAGEYVPGRKFRFVYYDDVRDVGDPSRAVRTAVASLNNHGLRGADFPVEKPSGTTRILFVGDSFTFGEGVADERTFPSLLQQRFDSQAGDPSYHVINAGVSGYNTRDELTYLRNRWLAFEPDLVILVFYLNDAYDDERFADLIMGGGHGQLQQVSESPSRLWALVETRYARWRAGRRVTEIFQSQFSGEPAIDGHDWEGSKIALSRVATMTRERGIPFAVVIFPELHALGDSHPFAGIYEQIEARVGSLGVPVLNLFTAFRGQRAEELWVHAADHHPNELAHRIAADAIWEFLRDPARGLLRGQQRSSHP
jgi:lysophospholipase L1-like esterase